MAASRGSVLATSLGAGGAGRCDGLTLRPKPILGGSGRRFGVAAGAVGTAGAAGGSSGAVRPKDTFTDASGRIATVISRRQRETTLGQKSVNRLFHSSVGQGRPLRPRTLQCNGELDSERECAQCTCPYATPRCYSMFSTEQRTAQPTRHLSGLCGIREFRES